MPLAFHQLASDLSANVPRADLAGSSLLANATFILTPSLTIKGWNDQAFNIFQYRGDEIVGKPIQILFDSVTNKILEFNGSSNEAISHNLSLKRKDGLLLNATVNLQPIFDRNRSLGIIIRVDILPDSAEKTPLLQKNSLFRQIAEHSYSGISLIDTDLKFIYRNPSAKRITGFSDSERVNATIETMAHPDERGKLKKILAEVTSEPGVSRSFNFRAKHAKGHYIRLECVFTNLLHLPDIMAMVLNFRDVTQEFDARILLEKTVRELTAYRYALDASAIVAITDARGRISHVNDNFCRISGYKRAELIGKDNRVINSKITDFAQAENIRRTLEAGQVWHGDFLNFKKNGDEYWVDKTIVPFIDKNGTPYQYISIRFDITEAKMARQRLEQKNKEIADLLESINDGFIALDSNLRYTYVNQRICKMVGMAADNMLGQMVWDIFPEAVGSATYYAIEQALATGQPVVNEDHYIPLNLWQENRIYPNKGGLSIFITDITDRKREEQHKNILGEISAIFTQSTGLTEQLLQASRTFVELGEFCVAEIWLVGLDNKQLILKAQVATDDAMNIFTKSNPEFTSFAKNQGLPGAVWFSNNILFWEDLEQHPYFQRAKSAGITGLKSALGIPLFNNDNVSGVLVLGKRNNERPRWLSDQQLVDLGKYLGGGIKNKQLTNELNDIFEVTTDLVCIVGRDGYFKKTNRAMTTLLGYGEAQLLNMQIHNLVHPDDLEACMLQMQMFENNQCRSINFENRYICANSEIINLAWTASKGSDDNIWYCIAKNITEQKKVENMLRAQTFELEASRKNYRDLFQLSPLPKLVFDSETLKILDVNKSAELHYGYSRDEFLGMTIRDIRPRQDIPMMEAAVEKARNVNYYFQPGKFTHCKKNGELIKVEITTSALIYQGRKARIALFVDVTERDKQLEAIKAQNQALRDISWMQSHIIRAPLARIMGLIPMLNNEPGLDPEMQEIFSYILISANELDDVITHITDKANAAGDED